jgi:HPt (histidine-containing phosphotransfer) domain-containing protein
MQPHADDAPPPESVPDQATVAPPANTAFPAPPPASAPVSADAPPRHTVTLDPVALQAIQELEDVGQPSLFAEMLHLFRSESSVRITQLRVALAERDAPLVFRLAHTIKGEALVWGASDLVEAAKVVETQARAGILLDLEVPINELEWLFKATVAALDAICQKPD